MTHLKPNQFGRGLDLGSLALPLAARQVVRVSSGRQQRLLDQVPGPAGGGQSQDVLQQQAVLADPLDGPQQVGREVHHVSELLLLPLPEDTAEQRERERAEDGQDVSDSSGGGKIVFQFGRF